MIPRARGACMRLARWRIVCAFFTEGTRTASLVDTSRNGVVDYKGGTMQPAGDSQDGKEVRKNGRGKVIVQ